MNEPRLNSLLNMAGFLYQESPLTKKQIPFLFGCHSMELMGTLHRCWAHQSRIGSNWVSVFWENITNSRLVCRMSSDPTPPDIRHVWTDRPILTSHVGRSVTSRRSERCVLLPGVRRLKLRTWRWIRSEMRRWGTDPWRTVGVCLESCSDSGIRRIPGACRCLPLSWKHMS